MQDDVANVAVEIALEAGRKALSYFEKVSLATGVKPDDTLFSEADRATEELILTSLQRSFPHHAVIAEETAGGLSAEDAASILASDHAWVIDPIDGTNNFVAGSPVWCVSLAHLERGLPTFGAIYFPALGDELYYNEGAVLILRRPAWNGKAAPVPLLPVPARFPPKPLFMAYDSFYFRHRIDFAHTPRISGCTVLNVLYVVLGKAIGATTSAHLWDFAAPMAFARHRGVRMIELLSGRDLLHFGPRDLDLDPREPRRLWRVKCPCLVAPEASIEPLRRTFRAVEGSDCAGAK
jgi:myo-inositol-1(or 4)-monophosphatase